jgi:hypothetical protein
VQPDRTTLAVLGREWLLHGHLQDRLGMALVMERASREEMQQVAIDEWMAASPIYSRRMQRAMGFEGTGVDTIMKNLQLDIGAPHEFMDFRYRLHDAEHGEFWLAHCGALMDVEPMGVEFVHGMCHTIEDPTFDATAGATNPKAQVRPLHRPPRVPADRKPHCHWRIDVVADAAPPEPHPNQALVADSELARVEVPTVTSSTNSDGLADYRGEFRPDFRLDDLSVPALHVALHEFAIQSHLLLRSFLVSVSQRWGCEFAAGIVPRLLAGWAGVTAQRLRAALRLDGDAAGLASMLRHHPLLNPASYIGVSVDVVGDNQVRLAFHDCPAARERDDFTWFSQLGGAAGSALARVVEAFEPTARLTPAAPRDGERVAFDAVIDPGSSPANECDELVIAKITTGAGFGFSRPAAGLLSPLQVLV